MHFLKYCLLPWAISASAAERADMLIERAGGKFVCRTDLPEWSSYKTEYAHCSSTLATDPCMRLSDILNDLVSENKTRVFECSVGVIAGLSAIGRFYLQTRTEAKAYRFYQLAMVYVYTLRARMRIPTEFEAEWNVSTDEILGTIQKLRTRMHYLHPIVPLHVVPDSFRNSNWRIGLVTICAYPEGHPLILQNFTPSNRYAYARRHGYEAIVHMEHPYGADSGMDIQHSKLALLADLLRTGLYDWLVWMDCDSVIVNGSKSIDSVIQKYATPEETWLLISEELLGLSSANWIVGNSDWSVKFLDSAFRTCHNQLPLFGDQDALITGVLKNGSVDSHVTIIPQNEINSYDALNAYHMGCAAYGTGDFLVTFPQCKQAACNALFEEAFKAAETDGLPIAIVHRTAAQLGVFGPVKSSSL